MKHRFSLIILISLILSILVSACGLQKATSNASVIALTNVRVIDGTGAAPIENAVVVVSGERIIAFGPAEQTTIPTDAQVIDLQGATLLPGLINAHVHSNYDRDLLLAWAQAGVTTVRDMGAGGSEADMTSNYALKAEVNADPQYARLVGSTPMLCPPKGYGNLMVVSVSNATDQVNTALDLGADFVKFSFEDYRPPDNNWPLLTPEEAKAIVDAAHARGVRASVHITWAKFAQTSLDAGVDEIAHIPMDRLDDAVIAQSVQQGVMWNTTLELWSRVNYSEVYPIVMDNLQRILEAGGQVALGTDYSTTDFDLGLPVTELQLMQEAGMSPMQVITAATQNGAIASGLEDELGTIEVGKIADLLVVSGDPSTDLTSLQNVRLVMHNGVIIRQE